MGEPMTEKPESVDSIIAEMRRANAPYTNRLTAALERERASGGFIGPKANCPHGPWNWKTESACPACMVEMRQERQQTRAELNAIAEEMEAAMKSEIYPDAGDVRQWAARLRKLADGKS